MATNSWKYPWFSRLDGRWDVGPWAWMRRNEHREEFDHSPYRSESEEADEEDDYGVTIGQSDYQVDEADGQLADQ
eukprot:8894276-Pyramimonas_sp.AAC.1